MSASGPSGPLVVIFQGGSGPPVTPSRSAHAMHTIMYIDADQTSQCAC